MELTPFLTIVFSPQTVRPRYVVPSQKPSISHQVLSVVVLGSFSSVLHVSEAEKYIKLISTIQLFNRLGLILQ